MKPDLKMFAGKYRQLKLILAALLAVAIVLIATSSFGAGISRDSVGYIASARSIAAGEGVLSYNGKPLVIQPPLFPAFLAAASGISDADAVPAARILNALLFGLIVYLSGRLFFNHFHQSPTFALFGLLFLLFSAPLISVSVMTWSEPLFIALVLLFLLSSRSYLEGKSLTALMMLALWAGLACLTRYIGVFLIVTGLITIFFINKRSTKDRIRAAIIFLVISGLPVVAWLARNYALTGTLWGPRAPSLFQLSDNFSYMFDTLVRWFLPGFIAGSRPLLLILGVGLGFLLGLHISQKDVVHGNKQEYSFNLICLVLVLAYTGFLIVSSTTTAFDKIGNRLLSPVLVPVTLLIWTFFEMILKPIDKGKKYVPYLLGLAVAVLLGTQLYSSWVVASRHLKEGSGFSGEAWQDSGIIQYLNGNPDSGKDCVIYSNGPDALYLFSGLKTEELPSRGTGGDMIIELSSLAGNWPPGNQACLVWFDRLEWITFYYTPEELLPITELVQEVDLNDGNVYYLKHK
jgi:4-amino-4-deoxy-L-arabinose transferase-like glycosyltransferase